MQRTTLDVYLLTYHFFLMGVKYMCQILKLYVDYSEKFENIGYAVDRVAQWIRRLPTEQETLGSIPSMVD